EKTPNEADAALKANILDFCEEHYEDILPVIMDKIRLDKRKEVHARLDFRENPRKSRVREGSQNSSAGTLPARQSAFDRLNNTYLPSATKSGPDRANSRDRSHSRGRLRRRDSSSRDRPRSRGRPCSIEESYGEEDLAVPWSCVEVDPFTPRIRNFKSSRKTRMPNNVKTYDGTGDPEDHVKFFQAAAQVERYAMPTWCHMFNSTLIGTARVWFDKLPPESIDGYKDLKAAFLDFIERFKVEIGRMKGAPECMRIFGFMHAVNNPELTKRLNEHVPNTMKEMMTATTAFIRGETAAASKKKGHISWKLQDQPKRHASERRSDFRAGKFKPPPPMVTPVDKRSNSKFYDFHNDKGYNTDECVQLKKQIKEFVRAGKLSRLIKEIKQGRDQPKLGKKEVPVKDKSMEIYMVQPWHRTTRQKVTQSFARVREITFPPLATSTGTEGPLVIEAEIGGHMIHRMYVDEGSSTEVLYEHCFNRLRPKIKSQMVSSMTSLTGFSGETIWPLEQLRLLVIIKDAEHSTKAWMNFMIVRSLSPYNGIIGRPGIREIQAVPSTAHGMLKFPVDRGMVTIRSTILISAIAEHRLNIREGYTPVRQKKRGQAPERVRAIQVEVHKLVEEGIMREVYYHDWLSNPVMVENITVAEGCAWISLI
nr:reverse transcriptase domain-containing protein [Tanacetum cinerariifolium]